MEAPDFWNDPEVSQNKMKEVKSLKDDVATYAALSAQYDDIETMIEMGYEENDPELIPEIDQMMKEFVLGNFRIVPEIRCLHLPFQFLNPLFFAS